jgi:cytochrome c biogenesis factor
VRWIWLGGIMIAIGGLFAAMDRRYRVAVKSRVAVPGQARSDAVAQKANA